MAIDFITRKPEETYALGQRLAKCLREGDVLCLEGNLGAGKTLLVAGIANALGVTDPVTSPTFNLMYTYPSEPPIYHFDLYRLDFPEELDDIGFYEYVGQDGIALIEWADKFSDVLPDDAVWLSITYGKEPDERYFHLEGGRSKEWKKELIDCDDIGD